MVIEAGASAIKLLEPMAEEIITLEANSSANSGVNALQVRMSLDREYKHTQHCLTAVFFVESQLSRFG